MLKRCGKCKQWKTLSEFYRNKRAKDGLNCYCKQCLTIYYRENKKRIAEYLHKYYLQHKRELAKYRHQHYIMHREEKAEHRRRYRETHKENKRRYEARKKGLGYNPLNEFFEGSVMHHINDNDIIFIPHKIHLRFNGNGFTTKKHQKAILSYYGSFERMIKNNPLRFASGE